ncbi:MAG TPA: type II secretion system protein [Candidatus Binatia bacterium]|nr:type II secretion system protein [Candidatus Binatia bacterium]
MRYSRFTNDSGFTMVELLLVVAIIGILAAMAIANFSLLKINALNATAASDARGLAPGVDVVATQEVGSPPSIPPFTGIGGPVLDSGAQPAIPGGRTSPGTFGTIEFPAPNQYVIKTFQTGGDCFTVTNGVMAAVPGACT